jgi:hypothetical protein
MWPGHPPIYFFSDENNLDAAAVIVSDKANWLDVLYQGLLGVRTTYPGLAHVFLMLDDHFPLRQCDEAIIAANYRAVVDNDLACLSFVTYAWPWDTTEQIEYPDHMIRTWRQIDLVRFGDCETAKVPTNFFRYNQLQPSFWNLDYLLDLCREAKARRFFDPWSFESFSFSAPRQHYVSRYAWPTVHHGFLAQGKVNPDAIDFIQMAEGRNFRAFLLKEAVGLSSMTAFRALRLSRRVIVAAARRLRSAAKTALAG